MPVISIDLKVLHYNRFLVLFNDKKCDVLFMELNECIAGRRSRSLGGIGRHAVGMWRVQFPDGLGVRRYRSGGSCVWHIVSFKSMGVGMSIKHSQAKYIAAYRIIFKKIFVDRATSCHDWRASTQGHIHILIRRLRCRP